MEAESVWNSNKSNFWAGAGAGDTDTDTDTLLRSQKQASTPRWPATSLRLIDNFLSSHYWSSHSVSAGFISIYVASTKFLNPAVRF